MRAPARERNAPGSSALDITVPSNGGAPQAATNRGHTSRLLVFIKKDQCTKRSTWRALPFSTTATYTPAGRCSTLTDAAWVDSTGTARPVMSATYRRTGPVVASLDQLMRPLWYHRRKALWSAVAPTPTGSPQIASTHSG